MGWVGKSEQRKHQLLLWGWNILPGEEDSLAFSSPVIEGWETQVPVVTGWGFQVHFYGNKLQEALVEG